MLNLTQFNSCFSSSFTGKLLLTRSPVTSLSGPASGKHGNLLPLLFLPKHLSPLDFHDTALSWFSSSLYFFSSALLDTLLWPTSELLLFSAVCTPGLYTLSVGNLTHIQGAYSHYLYSNNSICIPRAGRSLSCTSDSYI